MLKITSRMNILFAALMALAAGCQAESRYSTPTADDIPRLIQDLKEGDEMSRAHAAEALSYLGPDAKTALPALLLGLRDEAEQVRQNVLHAIIAIGPDATAIQPLTDSLKDSDHLVRALSANALGQLGSSARPSIPALREALQDRDPNVQKEAADALRAISASQKHVAN
jgi:HEAT repeat protein